MRGFEALGEAIAEVSSGHVFGLMGDGNMALLSYMGSRGLGEYHAVRHEASAVSMASGYARSTLRLGVATVTHGPGFTNALTALNAAVRDQSPVLLVVGELPVGAVRHAQLVDHQALAEVVGAHCVLADAPDSIPPAVAAAGRLASADRCPVVLRVSYEAMWGELTGAQATSAGSPDVRAQPPPAAAPAVLARLAELVRAASRPLVLVGRGAVVAGSEDQVSRLAAQIGAVIGTTLGARGACAGDPRCIGLLGGFAHPAAAELAQQSDLVVALGASLNDFTTRSGALLRDKVVVHVDLDVDSTRWVDGADLSIPADVRTVLDQLLAELGGEDLSGSYTLDRIGPLVARSAQWDLHDQSDELGLDPRTVVTAMDAAFPADRTVVADGGHLIEWASRHLSAASPRDWLACLGAGSIGLSTSLALGAAVGSGKPTLVVVGDGSCMMSLSDLDDAVRAARPLCVLIINDRAYGAEVHKLRQFGLPDTLGFFDTPSFAAVATALGAQSLTLRTLDDVAGLHQLDWPAVLARGPLVIDARVTGNVVSERLRIPANRAAPPSPSQPRRSGAALAGAASRTGGAHVR